MSTQKPKHPLLIDNLMDRDEFAEAMNITPRSADRWAWHRKGPPRFKIGNRVYYDKTDVEGYVQKIKLAASDGWGDV